MGQTISEKILAAHCGKKIVKPGELIMADVDIALANDVTAPIAIGEFYKSGAKDVFNRDKIVLVPDHFTPNKDIKSAMQVQILRKFAQRYKIKHFYDAGEVGIEHALLPEQGVVVPGDVVVGADSHTCTYGALGAFSTGVGSTDLAFAMITGKAWFRVPETIKFVINGELQKGVYSKDVILYIIGKIGVDGALYKAMEFAGSTISNLSVDARMTITNMAIEAGAKTGIIVPDDNLKNYETGHAERKPHYFSSDDDAEYSELMNINGSIIEPQVAFPHLPENTKSVFEAEKMNIKLDQVVIGSCTNGRIEDMELAAKILKGRHIPRFLRLIIFPATPLIYEQCIDRGYTKIFLKAGAIVSVPTCGPCLGGHMGVLAEGERAVSTTNRNFIGRMGHPRSEVYLTNPAVAAASALAGKIASPLKYLED